MNRSDDVARLARMIRQVAADSQGAPEGASTAEVLERVDRLDHGQSTGASRGVRKLRGTVRPEARDAEIRGLRAIVSQYRPVALIRGGVFEPLGSPWTHLEAAAPRKRIQSTFASIGRVELLEMPWTYGGTAFVVGPDLVMTNRHVAQQFCEGVGTGKGRLSFRPGEAGLDFKREVGSPEGGEIFHVRDVVMIHPYWDMALLRVDGLAPGHPSLTLATRESESFFGKDVVVIGYPARDDVRNDPATQDRIFGSTYNVKRLQPGKIRGREDVKSFGRVVSALTHDSSTLGGNSGSAVIDVATGEVVALHFGGIYLRANYGVPAYELARDPRVVDAGVRFRGRVAPTRDFEAAWAACLTASVGPVTPGVESARGQVPILHPNLRARRGYDPDFLRLPGDATVPLPTLTSKGVAACAKLESGSPEIKYHRFSVFLHKARRLALLTAANVDWRPAMRAPGGKKPTRSELTGIPDNVTEQWVTDPRLPDDWQLPDVFYTKDGGAFDKGHIVRRDDVCWGKTFDDIQKANGDTFHTTNCSPQVSAFNQGGLGVDNWGDLEGLVQRETRTEKIITFAGPVLTDRDPVFHGRDLRGETSIRIPRSYWKILVAATAGEPRAYGFVLAQSLKRVPGVEELSVPQEWVRHMQSIEAIEKLLRGLVKLDWLKVHDAFGTATARRVAKQVTRPARP